VLIDTKHHIRSYLGIAELPEDCKGHTMMFNEPTHLGRTGLRVGRLGISSSFGAPTDAFEAAFERVYNYFTWGTFIRGRSSAMQEAIRNISARGRREDLVVAMLTYAHHAWLTKHYFTEGLKAAKLEILDKGPFPNPNWNAYSRSESISTENDGDGDSH
jgi:hypothetical protein